MKIVEYDNYKDYLGDRPNKILLNKRNAVHKDHASILLAKALTNQSLGSICYMVFGNGGATINSGGSVVFNSPNITTPTADLYNPTYFQMVDDRLGALPGNAIAVRHISNSQFSDVDIRCLIAPNQPFSQISSNLQNEIDLNTNAFAFNEIGLKLIDGTLITHVTFSPILKHAESLLEVIYTLRIAVGQPPPIPPPVIINLAGVHATASVSSLILPPLGGVRLNDSPYFANIQRSLSDSSQGTLSLWLRGTDTFNMAHDEGPALLSSNFRNSLDISGRGYVRRNPSAITRANPCHVTIPSHGLATGDQIQFTKVNGGCSELQGLTENVTVINSNTVSIPVDSSGFASAYTGPALVAFPTHNRTAFNTLRIAIRDSDTNPTKMFYWNSSEQIPANQWVNLLISWDMNFAAGSKVLQVFVNNTQWTSTSDPTYRYDPDTAFTVPYSDNRKWFIGEPIIVPTLVQTSHVAREILRSRT